MQVMLSILGSPVQVELFKKHSPVRPDGVGAGLGVGVGRGVSVAVAVAVSVTATQPASKTLIHLYFAGFTVRQRRRRRQTAKFGVEIIIPLFLPFAVTLRKEHQMV